MYFSCIVVVGQHGDAMISDSNNLVGELAHSAHALGGFSTGTLAYIPKTRMLGKSGTLVVASC